MSHAAKSWQLPALLSPLYIVLKINQLQQANLSSSLTLTKLLGSTLREESITNVSLKMATKLQDLVMGIPVITATYTVRKSSRAISSKPHNHSQSYMHSPASVSSKHKSVLKRMNKLGQKADGFAHGIREHVRLSPKISETLKGKLSLGARILQIGGMEKVFRHLFSVREGERLTKASQCYLSTTAGLIAGLLFISTEKVAFCSERSIKLSSPNGESVRTHYKVSIPLSKIEEANQSENVERPSEKYIQIVTVDNFDFWFMGFLNHQKTLKHLQRAISQA